MADAEPTSMTFATFDDSESLELSFRALPYRPLTIGGKQRTQFTWYPGSAHAIVQMLGPEEAPITMSGYWKDRFIQDPSAGRATYNGEQVNSVASLVSIVDMLRRTGLRLKMSWGDLVRYGHITYFTQTWHTVHDCEWELEFSVASQDEGFGPLITADPPSVVRIAAQFEPVATLKQDLVQNPFVEATDRLAALTAALNQQINDLSGFLTGLAIDSTRRALSPFAAARSVSSTLAANVRSLGAAVNTLTGTALDEWVAFTGGQDDAPIGEQVNGYTYVEDWSSAVNAASSFCARARYEIEVNLQRDLISAFIAPEDMDLRDVSQEFYGTPDNWRELMIYNGLADSRLSAGDLVWVPTSLPNTSSDAGGAGSAGRG